MIRLTHDGMLVKSMLVPEVDATAVPETSGYNTVLSPLPVMLPVTPNVPVIVSLPEFVTPGVVTPAVPSNVIAMIAPYSNKIFIVPASKVSVPLTVVMRTRSRVPERALEPPTVYMVVVPVSPKFPEQTQEFEPISVSTNVPSNAAVAFPDLIVKPVVYTLTPGVALMVLPVHAYPDVSTEPAPIWIIGGLVPLVLTPFNITVIRFTQDGMPVKSLDVPEVVACDVPLTNCDPVPGTVSHGYQVAFASRYT